MANDTMDGLPGYRPISDEPDEDVKVYSDASAIKYSVEGDTLSGLPSLTIDSMSPEQKDATYYQIARGGGASLRHVQSEMYNRKVDRGEIDDIGLTARLLKMMGAHWDAGLETLKASYKEVDVSQTGSDQTEAGLAEIEKHDKAAAEILNDESTGGGTFGLPPLGVGLGGFLQSSLYTFAPIVHAVMDKGNVMEKSMKGPTFDKYQALSNTAKYIPFWAVSLHETAAEQRELGLNPADHIYELVGTSAVKMAAENASMYLTFGASAVLGKAGMAAIKGSLGLSAVDGLSKGILKNLGYGAVRYAGAVSFGGATEGAQNLLDMFSAHYVLGKTKGMDEDEAIQSAWERSTTPRAMAGHFEAGEDGLWMEAAGGALLTPFGMMRAGAQMRRAARNAYAFKATAETVARYGDNASGLAAEQTTESGLQSAKMGWNEFHAVVGDLEGSPGGKAEFVALGGDPLQYDAAKSDGSDLTMDAGKFVEKIGRAGLGDKVFQDVKFNDQELTLREADKLNADQHEETERATAAVEAIDSVRTGVVTMKSAESNEAKVEALDALYREHKNTPEVAGMLLEAASELSNDLDDQEKARVKEIVNQYAFGAEEGSGGEIRAALARDESLKTIAEAQVAANAVELGTMVASGAMDQDTANASAIVRDRMRAGGMGESESHALGMIWGRWYKYAGENYMEGGTVTAVDMATAYAWEFESGDNTKALGLARNDTMEVNIGHMAFDATKEVDGMVVPAAGVRLWSRDSSPGMGIVLAHESAHSFHYMLMNMANAGTLSALGKKDLATIDRAYDMQDRVTAVNETQRRMDRVETELTSALQAQADVLNEKNPSAVEINIAQDKVVTLEASLEKATNANKAANKRYSEVMERFAIHTERFFEEDIAPSAELKGVFSRMKKWAKQLVGFHADNFGSNYDREGRYSSNELNEIRPHEREAFNAVREVLNRWWGPQNNDTQLDMALASTEASEGAGAFLSAELMEALAEPAKVSDEKLASFGFSRKEAQYYAKLISEDNDKARDKLADRLSAKEYKKKAGVWNAAFRANRDKALKKLDAHEEYSALSILQGAKTPSGIQIVQTTERKLKLNHEEAVNVFGEEEVARLNSLRTKITTKNGYSLEDAAIELNMQDGPHLAHALKGIMSVDDKATAMARETTLAEEGPAVTEEDVRSDIDDALNNDKRAVRLRYELKHLASERTAAFMKLTFKVSTRIPSAAQSRMRAMQYVSTLVAADLKPSAFALTERKNSRMARESYRKGDLQAAADFKLKELMAYENYRAAKSAQDSHQRAVKFFKDKQKLSSQKRLGKGGEGVQELFNLVASVMGSRAELSAQEMERVPDLTSMLIGLKSEASAPFDAVLLLDPLLAAAEVAPEMTVAQSEASYVVGRFLSKAASVEAELQATDRRDSRSERIDDMVGQLAESHKNDRALTPGFASDETAWRKTLAGLKEYAAAHLKMEFVFDGLDANAGVSGNFHQAFMAPLLKSQEAAGVLHKKSHDAMSKAFSTYSKSERRALGKKRHFVKSLDKSISKWDAIMVAMNWGNLGNREALTGGQRGLSADSVSEMLGILDARDADLIQSIFNEIDSHWAAASAVNRRQTGITPGKVQAAAFEVGGKEIPGGYFPIAIDRKQDNKTKTTAEAAKALDDLAKDSPSLAMTSHGHLKARTGTGGRPLLLSPTVISNHLSSVIHDITHRETVLDAWFMTKDPQFARAVTAAAGKETYDLMAPWLMSVARADVTDAADVFDRATSWMRNRVTGALLAFNHGTMLSQITGMTLSLRELGPVSMLKGMRAAFANGYNPIQGYRAATEKSAFMRERIAAGYERETAAILKNSRDVIASIPGMTSEITNAGLQLIGVAQMMVDLPTWWGAYIQAMDGDSKGIAAGDEKMAIEHADHLVRMTQGESGPLSSSAVQRKQGLFKWLVMFYTFFGTQINLIGREIGKVRRDGVSALPEAMVGLSMIIMTQVMEDAIRGRYAYDEDDDDEHITQVLKKAGVTAVTTPFSGMIGVRDVASMVAQRGRYGRVFNMNPVFGAAKAAVEGGYSIGEHIADPDKTLTKKTARDIAIGVGTATGMPGLEAFKIGELLLSEGK